jgi:hypothetical protein
MMIARFDGSSRREKNQFQSSSFLFVGFIGSGEVTISFNLSRPSSFFAQKIQKNELKANSVISRLRFKKETDLIAQISNVFQEVVSPKSEDCKISFSCRTNLLSSTARSKVQVSPLKQDVRRLWIRTHIVVKTHQPKKRITVGRGTLYVKTLFGDKKRIIFLPSINYSDEPHDTPRFFRHKIMFFCIAMNA